MYPAMEDYAIDIIIGKGPRQLYPPGPAPVHPHRGHHPGRPALRPLRDRFGVMLRLELYSPEELSQIVTRSARILGVPIEEAGAVEIARRARGTPRIANRLLRRVRDFAQVRAGGSSPKGWPTRPSAPWRSTTWAWILWTGGCSRSIIQHYAGGPVGAGHLGRHRRGGGRDPGGRVRTLPHADWLPHPHPRGGVRHPPGLCAPGAALPRPGPGPAPPVTGDRVPAPGKCTKSRRGKARFPTIFDKVLDFLGLVDYNKNIKSMSVEYGKNISIPDEVLCAQVAAGNRALPETLVLRYARLVRVCARPLFLAGETVRI